MRLKLTCRGCRRNIEIEGESIPQGMVCPDCDTPLVIPNNILSVDEELDGYRIVKHIGSGSMGCVYEAIQLSMNRPVALKVLDPALTENEEEVQAFLHEVQTLGRLQHHNIVAALDTGEADGQYYLSMALVEGHTLEEIIEHDGPRAEAEVINIGKKIAEALYYAWTRHGILHRDVKPSNIMLHKGEDPKLLDLGICMVKGAGITPSMEGLMVGTPYYMSPEQAAGRADLDCRSDIYALGCTLYHAVTGEVPYDGPGIEEIVKLHRDAPLPSPRELCPELSKAFARMLRTMMAKDPADRPASWEEVILQFDRLISKESDAAGTERLPPAAQQEPAARPKRHLTVSKIDRLHHLRDELQRRRQMPLRTMIFLILLLILLALSLWLLANKLPSLLPAIKQQLSYALPPPGPTA